MTRHTYPRTLRFLGLWAVTVTATFLVACGQGAQNDLHIVTPSPTATNPDAEVVANLMRANGCYSGDNPNPGTIPRSAVVTLPGEDPKLANFDTGFAIAEGTAAGVLHGFCN